MYFLPLAERNNVQLRTDLTEFRITGVGEDMCNTLWKYNVRYELAKHP